MSWKQTLNHRLHTLSDRLLIGADESDAPDTPANPPAETVKQHIQRGRCEHIARRPTIRTGGYLALLEQNKCTKPARGF